MDRKVSTAYQPIIAENGSFGDTDLVSLISWGRLEVCCRNVAIPIGRHHNVRQTIISHDRSIYYNEWPQYVCCNKSRWCIFSLFLLWCFSIFLFQRNVSHAHLIQVCIASVRYISFVSITWSNVEYRKSFQTGQWSIASNLQQFIISLFHCPGTQWYSLEYFSLHFFYNSSLKCGRHGFESRRSWNFCSRLLFWSFLSCRSPARVLSSLECHFMTTYDLFT